jgi:hypothetical protein
VREAIARVHLDLRPAYVKCLGYPRAAHTESDRYIGDTYNGHCSHPVRAIQRSYSLVKHPAETKKIDEKSSQAFARERSDSDMTLLCFVDTVCIFSRNKKIPSRPSFIGSNSELKQSKLFVSYSVLTKVNHQNVSH